MEASDAVGTDETATDEEVVVGETGLEDVKEGDQEPTGSEDGHGTHTPSSANPPSAQSGVPLSEDKAAGVEPDPKDVSPPGAPKVAATPGL